MSRSTIPIMTYHAVDPRDSILSVTPQIFEWQMKWLYENKFQVLPLRDIVRSLKDRKSLPERAVAITFDDGFEGTYQYAFPVLKRYRFPATVFVVTNYCGKDNAWSGQPGGIPRMALEPWESIIEMDRAGVEIGSHTINHPRLDRISSEKAEQEIIDSKRIIEQRLGHPIDFLAYPYGRYDQQGVSLAKREYSGAVTSRLEVVRDGDDPHLLSRVDAYYLRSPSVYKILSMPKFMRQYLWVRRILHESKTFLLKRTWA